MKTKSGKTHMVLMSLAILFAAALAFSPGAALAQVSVSADAGPNVTISTAEVAGTIIHGSGNDPDTADSMLYRWLEASVPLVDWTSAGTLAVDGTGQCPLDLGALAVPLGVGEHVLTLEVSAGGQTATDQMILTIGNSAPNVIAGGGGTYEIGTTVDLTGQVSDFDGDELSYHWKEGSNEICSGTVTPSQGGAPVALLPCPVTGLGLGDHTITLELSDGINAAVTSSITVKIVDSTKPTLAPVADRTILWPPNHAMVKVTIMANASDNSGKPVVLSATVTSDEEVNGQGDGNTAPDWLLLSLAPQTGEIVVLLRAERSGKGDGREYTVRVTATDASGNKISADVKVVVPHDQGGAKNLVWRHGPTGINVIWHMKGKKLINWEYFGGVVDAGWTIVGTDDMNNDGQPDILWRHAATGITVVWYMNGTTLVGWELLGGIVDSGWSLVGTGDVNGDGSPDLVWRHAATGMTVVWYMNGATFIGWGFWGDAVGSDWSIAGIDDLNSDGNPDILWRHNATGTTVVWYMKGAVFAGWEFLGGVVDSNWAIAGTGDINGDGAPDILWRHGATGTNAVWYLEEGKVTGSDMLPSVFGPGWKMSCK